MIKNVLLFVFLIIRCFETQFESVCYQNYPNQKETMKLAIQEIGRYSEYSDAPIPEYALKEEYFTGEYLGMEGIWMNWWFNFRFADHKTGLYYYGYVQVDTPPRNIEVDAGCMPVLNVDPITKETEGLLEIIEAEQQFSDVSVDAWNYKKRADFYKQYGYIRDLHVLNNADVSSIEAIPVYPGIGDPSYYEALLKTIAFYYTDYLSDTLFNSCFICKKHGLLCRDLCNTVIGSGFYERITGERFWIIRIFKVLNIGGQNELLNLHAFRIENGEVYPSI